MDNNFYWDPSKPFCMSAQTDKLDEALAKVIPEIPAISKNGRSHHGAYVLLDDIYEAIREPLRKHGVTCEQYSTLDGWVILRIAYKGQWIVSSSKAPEDANAKNKIQAMGGAISYLKRYGLGATFRISTDEDNDGNEKPHAPQKNYNYESGRKITEAQLKLLNDLLNKLPNHVAAKAKILDTQGITSLADLEASAASEYIGKLKQ